jgi:hypothetical protein
VIHGIAVGPDGDLAGTGDALSAGTSLSLTVLTVANGLRQKVYLNYSKEPYH